MTSLASFDPCVTGVCVCVCVCVCVTQLNLNDDDLNGNVSESVFISGTCTDVIVFTLKNIFFQYVVAVL